MLDPVKLGIFRDDDGAELPAYATPFSSGVDLMSMEKATIPPGGRLSVGTGIRLEIPAGYECQVRPRSGLALKHGVTVLNAPGTIDADYRGEVRVILVNLGENPFEIEKGDRIAQMVLAPVSRIDWKVKDSLSRTDRGSGGFGSTGR